MCVVSARFKKHKITPTASLNKQQQQILQVQQQPNKNSKGVIGQRHGQQICRGEFNALLEPNAFDHSDNADHLRNTSSLHSTFKCRARL